MISKTISHYKILEKLGGGGMGVVYKTIDTKLDRTVALKFLPEQLHFDEEAEQRFISEAKSASSLDHPNICTIHDINKTEDGQFYIVMGYYAGETLKKKVDSGSIKIDTAINYATQIATGLARAHEAGIVHRDIKPANIMITDRNEVKILDFGLAKTSSEPSITKMGSTVGTVAYMSPEQTKGEYVDHRTDIWSFGVLLYEMITGQLLFKGEYDQAIIYSILNESPPPISDYDESLPEKLNSIIQKMLGKNPGERYQNMTELIDELEKVTSQQPTIENESAETERNPSIAILPFANMSEDKANEYFSDGLAEDIINALAQIRDLRVVARTSAFSFKNKETDIREIGEKLNVNTILEGSVRKANNQVRITAQLINVEDGFHLWSEQYDRNLDDIFGIQDEITFTIVDKLKGHLLKEEKSAISRRRTENQEAFNLYLKGRHFWNNRTGEGMRRGIECFENATEIEPNYALAYSGMADAYSMIGAYYYLPAKESYPKAIRAANKAIAIDDSLAEAHCALGYAIYEFNWDWTGAEESFKKGLKINPGYSFGHACYAHCLFMLGRFEDAEREIKLARDLDPLGLITNANVGYCYFLNRKYDLALEEYNKALEIDPSFHPLLAYMAEVYEQKGMIDESIKAMKLAYAKSEMNAKILAILGHIYGTAGNTKEANKILDELEKRSRNEFVSASNFTLLYLGMNQKDQVFEWLEKAYEEKAPFVCYLKVDPRFDKIRDDERFTDLKKRVGLD